MTGCQCHSLTAAPAPGGRGGGEREGGECSARSAPEGGARAHWALRLPPRPLAPPPSCGPPSLASAPQRPRERHRILTPGRVLGPPDRPSRPANAVPAPRLLITNVNSQGCKEMCMGHWATRSKATHVLPRSAASFTPRTAPGTFSRSCRQEVVPSGFRLPAPGQSYCAKSRTGRDRG